MGARCLFLSLSSFFPVSLCFLLTCHFESVFQLSVHSFCPSRPLHPHRALPSPWQQPSFALPREQWPAPSRVQAASWVPTSRPPSLCHGWGRDHWPHFTDRDTDAWRSNSVPRATRVINEEARTQAQLSWPTGSRLRSEPRMCVRPLP